MTAVTPHTIFADAAEAAGLSRPAGLCFGAILRASAPTSADALVAELGIARSNVSVALKELRSWHLVETIRIPGDRKEYFRAPDDPWETIRLVFAGRQARVFAPVLERLLEAEADGTAPSGFHEALDSLDTWLRSVAALDRASFRAFLAAAPGRDRPKAGKRKKRKG